MSQRSKAKVNKKRSSGIGTPNTDGKPGSRLCKDTKLPLYNKTVTLGTGSADIPTDTGDDIDVGTDPAAPATSPVTGVVTDPDDSRLKCPCNLSDRTSSYVVCTGCLQEWHQNCVNLIGITPGAILKLRSWLCPRCHVSPYSPTSTPPPCDDPIKEFFSRIEDIKKCNEELKGSTSQVEWFNLHVKKLILDDAKFVDYSSKIDSLVTVINVLNKKLVDVQVSNYSEDVIAKSISDITEKVASANLNDELATSLKSSEKAIQDLSDQITDLQAESKLPDMINAIQAKLDNHYNQVSSPCPMSAKLDTLMSSISLKLEAVQNNEQKLFEELEHIKASICLPAVLPDLPNTSILSHQVHQSEPVPPSPPRVPHQPTSHLLKSFIDSADLLKSLHHLVDTHQALQDLSNRKVAYFGEFTYKYGKISHSPKSMPKEIQDVVDIIHTKFPKSMRINSCLINIYDNGTQHIPRHSDDEPDIAPESDIFTLSLGATRSLVFSSLNDSDAENIEIRLEDNSLLSFSRSSQVDWAHSIPVDSSVVEKRVSFTFRCLSPHNRNSVVIIGDSNCRELLFGTGKGKLGAWMPGRSIEAKRISDIPSPNNLGPYRNFIIHVGVNDVNFRKDSDETLVALYESKCRSILKVYPHSRLVISLLPPTKSFELNRACSDLNSRLVRMVMKLKSVGNVEIVEHHYLLDSRGFLDPTLGRHVFDQRLGVFTPKHTDAVHLGKEGIRLLVRAFKGKIIQNYKNQVGSSRPMSGGRNSQRPPQPAWRHTSPHQHPCLSADQQWSWPPLPSQPCPPPFPSLGFPPRAPAPGYVRDDQSKALVGPNASTNPTSANGGQHR